MDLATRSWKTPSPQYIKCHPINHGLVLDVSTFEPYLGVSDIAGLGLIESNNTVDRIRMI